MILDKVIKIKGHPKNLKHYRDKGYDISVGDIIEVNTDDLSSGSTFRVKCKCDGCLSEKEIIFKEYYNRTNSLNDKYYCSKCRGLKIKKTCLEKYGVDNPMKSNHIRDKLKETCMEKYGVDHFSKTQEYKDKYKSTCMEKYGVDNASKSKSIRKIISNVKFEQFNSVDKYKDLVGEEYKIDGYNRDERTFRILHSKCNEYSDIFIVTLSDRIRNKNILCTTCNPIDKLSSGRELELIEYIDSLGFDIVCNSYDLIPPQSIDVFIPKLNIGFEFNGVYWHSDKFKNKRYHIDKTNKCLDNNIDLIHIWEDDWVYRNDIVKSIIKNKLGLIKNKIYARKCEVRYVDDIKLVKDFLNKNHIQGYSNSKYKLGLFYGDELVSLMVFGKKRKQMELVRFCNKLEFNVIGGASKLFNFFIKDRKNDEIISYSDISMFDGGLYKKLGFELQSQSDPSFHWVVDGIRKHRFNFNKSKLIKMFNIEDEYKSESVIMRDMGYYKIWNCGLKKWIYKV